MYPELEDSSVSKVKLCEIINRRPIYIPPPPYDYDDLVRLVHKGKDTDTEELIKYIYRRISDEGILYTLVNRLYEMRSNDIEFYVPELVYVGIKLTCKPILKFLIDSSQTSLRLFCLIYWNVQAFGFQMKDKSMEIRQRLDSYQKEMVRAMVSSPHDIEMFGFEKPKIGFDVIKTIRRQHCQYFLRFINKIVRTSLDLKKVDEDKRKQKLKQEISKANQSLKMWADKYKQYKIKTHQGIIIPFRRQRHQHFLSTMVVGIVENECSCFNTRKRVPYRIVLQTVDPQDFQKFHSKSPSRKTETVSLANSVDTFLQDIPEVDSIPPIQVIKAYDEEENMKSFAVFVTNTINYEIANQAINPNNVNNSTNVNNSNNLTVNNNNLNVDLKNSRPDSRASFNQGMTRRNTFRKSKPFVEPIQIRQAKSEIIMQEPQFAYDKELYFKNLQNFQNFFPKRQIGIKRSQSVNAATRYANKLKAANLTKTTTNLHNPSADKTALRFSQRKINNNQRNQFIQTLEKTIKDKSILQRLKSIEIIRSPSFDDRDLNNLWVEQMTGIKKFGPWEELWHNKVERFKTSSVYAGFPSYKLRNVIVKGGDDLRQEIVCMQVIAKIKDIFVNAGLRLYLRPYEIIVTSESSGILQFVTNGISIDELKKKSNEDFISLAHFYQEMYKNKVLDAQKKFAESLAAYSILTYILQIKDRHNGNILIDYEGHIVHIDFGFIFSTSPGNWNFQSSPFKLTAQYIELLDGQDSELYLYFKQLFFQGFNELKKHVDQICTIVDMMSQDSDLPCFKEFTMPIFRDRFKANYDDHKMKQYCEGLISQSCRNWRTVQYDYFQYLTNQIAQ